MRSVGVSKTWRKRSPDSGTAGGVCREGQSVLPGLSVERSDQLLMEAENGQTASQELSSMWNRDQSVQPFLSQLRASAGLESDYCRTDFLSCHSVGFLCRFHDLLCLSRGYIGSAVGSGCLTSA